MFLNINLLLLCITIKIYPIALLNELAMLIYSEGCGIYLSITISKRLNNLHIKQKKASIEAHTALSTQKILRE